MIDDLARDLLRRHVVRRSHDETGLGFDGGAFAERDTEVQDLCGAARKHLDVAGLHVPVDHSPFVRVVEPAADLGDDVDAVLEPLGLLLLHELSEARALQELHHDVGRAFALELAEIEDGDDVRVLEVRRGLRLPLKAAAHLLLDEELFRHHLDRHQAIEPRITGLVDGPHGAATELRQDLVFSDPGWRRRHNALVSDEIRAVSLYHSGPMGRTRQESQDMGERIDAFNQFRSRMNESILGKGTLQTKRFFNLDGAVYEDGALSAKTKELLGLSASMVLRCNDCITYHVLQCHERGVTPEEMAEALDVALIVGGSIVIPHLRHARAVLDELQEDARRR